MDIAITPTSFLPTLANPCLLPVPGPTQHSEFFQHWILKQLGEDGMELTRMEAKGTFWNDGSILGVVIRWVYKFIKLIYVIVLKSCLNKVECK